jgi:hypothetical protein
MATRTDNLYWYLKIIYMYCIKGEDSIMAKGEKTV